MEDEDVNPFSFKKFVTATDNPKGRTLEVVDDDEDIFKVPDRRQETSKTLLISNDDSVPKKSKKKGKNENPFSFKKFLSGGTSKKAPAPTEGIPEVNKDQNVLTQPIDNGLPDFVQDHYHHDTPTGDAAAANSVHKSHSSDSFELPLDLPHLAGNNAGKADCVKIKKVNKKASSQQGDRLMKSESLSSSEDEDTSSDFMSANKDNFGNILPDFLSEVSKNEASTLKKGRPEVQESDNRKVSIISQDSDSIINGLREENSRLKDQIQTLENRQKDDQQRISELEQQVEEQRKKEVEETSIMESAMEQVEENLKITTQRAVNAESNISKLKQEIKTLQEDSIGQLPLGSCIAEIAELAELKVHRGDNGLGHTDYLSDVKERTSYVAEQLSTATKTAESSLRELLAGVDKLKLLSQVLDSVDKIREQKEGNEYQGDATS